MLAENPACGRGGIDGSRFMAGVCQIHSYCLTVAFVGRGEWAKASGAILVWISKGVKNVKTTVKAHLLRSTLLAALSVASGAIGSAYAQQTTTTTTTETGPEEAGDVVVVTGSRIARQDFTAISPVTTVGAADTVG